MGQGDDARDGRDDLFRVLGPEGRDPAFRRYVTERLRWRVADLALRRRVMDLLGRDAATLDEGELRILRSTLVRAFDDASAEQQEQERFAELTLGGSDPLWPDRWPRPATMAFVSWLGVFWGVFGLIAGIAVIVAMAGEGLRPSVAWGATMAGFGAAVLFGFATMSLRFGTGSAPRLVTVQDSDAVRTGVLLPYSRVRVAMGMISGGGWALCGAGLLTGGAGGFGWPWLVLGPVVLLAGVALIVRVRPCGDGRSGLLFTPDAVVSVRGPKRTFVPWGHIFTLAPSHRGIGGPPELELTVTGKAAIETTTTKPGVIRRRRGAVDLGSVIWMLAVDPSVVYAALRHYIARPDRRAELADERGVQRMVSRDLVVRSRRREDLITDESSSN
jgi:hypothetical protein